MTSKKDIEKKLEEQLDAFGTKIDKLELKMQDQRARASELEKKAMSKLISMRSEARTKLRHYKYSGEDKWEEASASLDKYWQSLGTELKAYEGRL